MSAQTPFQTETRSSRRRAANGGVDPERRAIDPSTHEFVTTKGELSTPLRVARRISRRDHSRSPANPSRVYRTRAKAILRAESRQQLNVAHHPWTSGPERSGLAPSRVERRESSTEAKLAKYSGEGHENQNEDSTEEVDAVIGRIVEAHDEQAANDEGSATASLKTLQSNLKNIAIEDQTYEDLEADLNHDTRRIRDEQLIKQEESTFVDALWLEYHPLLEKANDETLLKEYAPSTEAPAQNATPVSDDFPRSFLAAGAAASPHDLFQLSYDHLGNLTKDDAASAASVASQHSNNYGSPFDWCSNSRCPIYTLHHPGLYLESGEVPRQNNEQWGWSDPPAKVWEAWAKLSQGHASEYEENMVAGFKDAHYWEGPDTSDFLAEQIGME